MQPCIGDSDTIKRNRPTRLTLNPRDDTQCGGFSAS